MEGAFRVDKALDMLAEGSVRSGSHRLDDADRSGMDVVEAVARDHPHAGVVMFTGYATVDSAVESMNWGHWIISPSRSLLKSWLRRQRRPSPRLGKPDVTGRSSIHTRKRKRPLYRAWT